jgi:hypothetical protein
VVGDHTMTNHFSAKFQQTMMEIASLADTTPEEAHAIIGRFNEAVANHARAVQNYERALERLGRRVAVEKSEG